MKLPRLCLIVLLALASGAGPVADPESLLRAGDAAAARGDFEAAVADFQQALERTTDPAPAAFNLAVARLRLASTCPPAERNRELLEAELLFASFTGESDNSDLEKRRTLALYGLGVCRLLRAEAGDLAAARAAVGCLRDCMRDPTIEPALLAAARHNLARARLLTWQLTPPHQQGEPQDPAGDGKDPQPPRDPKEKGTRPSTGDKPDPKQAGDAAIPPDGAEARDTKIRNPHGRSGPPSLPDDKSAISLTPGDAAIYLEKAARALRADRELQRRQQAASPARPGIRDW